MDGKVYLDARQPRVCVRGPELRDRPDLGYAWLAADEIFPFWELRAAAQDLRDGSRFDETRARRTIDAIFATLAAAGIRHAVLGVLGCGAFENPPERVARLFREVLPRWAAAFDMVAFAIHHPDYAPDNFTPFGAALADLGPVTRTAPAPASATPRS